MRYFDILKDVLMIAGLLALVAAPGPAAAAEPPVGPSHCFQAAESVNEKLAALGGVVRGPVADDGAPPHVARSPRHCFAKARELWSRVQELRRARKLATAPPPEFPAREVVPADVLEVIRGALAALTELEASFPARRAPPVTAFVAGKAPTDVYYALAEAELRLSQLGGPPLAPADCLRTALEVEAGLDAVRAARKVTTAVAAPVAVAGKRPADCYAQARGLQDDLAKVATGDLALPGGVPVVGARSGEVQPGHVHDLLATALADVGALASKCGAARPAPPPPAAGKTPSDVYAQIVRARLLARSLAR